MLKVRLKICISYLGCSQIWLNIPGDDDFFNNKKIFLWTIVTYVGYINSFILKNYFKKNFKKKERVPTQVLVTRTLN
jgi:hypothetical protein